MSSNFDKGLKRQKWEDFIREIEKKGFILGFTGEYFDKKED